MSFDWNIFSARGTWLATKYYFRFSHSFRNCCNRLSVLFFSKYKMSDALTLTALNQLDTPTLLNLCKSSKYYDNLCKSSATWRYLIKKDFAIDYRQDDGLKEYTRLTLEELATELRENSNLIQVIADAVANDESNAEKLDEFPTIEQFNGYTKEDLLETALDAANQSLDAMGIVVYRDVVTIHGNTVGSNLFNRRQYGIIPKSLSGLLVMLDEIKEQNNEIKQYFDLVSAG